MKTPTIVCIVLAAYCIGGGIALANHTWPPPSVPQCASEGGCTTKANWAACDTCCTTWCTEDVIPCDTWCNWRWDHQEP